MKTKRENPLKVLFSFSGEARGKMTGSVILAFIGEMFGMAPYFVVTLLAKELYEGTATVERAAVMAVTAAVCMCLRAWLTGLVLHAQPYSFLHHPEEHPVRSGGENGESPHGRHAGDPLRAPSRL